jgi:Tfp pilus assembly protein FimV
LPFQTSTLKTQRFFELGSSSDNPIDLVSLDDEPTLQQIEEPTSVDNPIIVSDEELSDLDEVRIPNQRGILI